MNNTSNNLSNAFKKVRFAAILTIVLISASFIPAVFRYVFNSGEAIIFGFSQEMPAEAVRFFFVGLTLFLFFISRTLLSRIVWGLSSALFLLGLFAWLISGLNNETPQPEYLIPILLTGLTLGITEYFSNVRNKIGQFVK